MTPVETPRLAKSMIESALAEYFGRRYCCLTNRGTTALAAALAALERPGARALFPAAMCSIPVFAAKFAGWEPAFADVDLDDGNFLLPDVERSLKEGGGSIGAVVPVHMFGQPDRVEDLQALCDHHDADLIEDVALSMGAVHNGKRAGSFGRVACLSFVRKMLPLEMGGAVLTDEEELDARVRRWTAALPPAPPAETGRERTRMAMKAFHALTAYVAAGGWKERRLLAPFEEEFRRLLLARTVEEDWADSIVLRELETLEDTVRARRARAEVFQTALNHPRLRPLRHDESCFFAYPVRLVGASAESFLEFAGKEGFDFKRVAYPAIDAVFGEPAPGAAPNARLLEKEVMGFPVDDNQPVSAFWDYAADFERLFARYAAEEASRPASPWEGKLELRMS